jgi:hypothetical protein
MNWLKKVQEGKLNLKSGQVQEPKSWFETQDALFEDRQSACVNLGLGVDEGKAIALRLYLRDYEKDERILCYECKHLISYAETWRCKNYIEAGISMRESGSGLGGIVDLLQRCNGFSKV